MRKGTKRLFPTDYEEFKEEMLEAYEGDELPVTLKLDDIKDFTLKDFQDAFIDFRNDTGLNIEGAFFICEDCGNLHVLIEVDIPEYDENAILQ